MQEEEPLGPVQDRVQVPVDGILLSGWQRAPPQRRDVLRDLLLVAVGHRDGSADGLRLGRPALPAHEDLDQVGLPAGQAVAPGVCEDVPRHGHPQPAQLPHPGERGVPADLAGEPAGEAAPHERPDRLHQAAAVLHLEGVVQRQHRLRGGWWQARAPRRGPAAVKAVCSAAERRPPDALNHALCGRRARRHAQGGEDPQAKVRANRGGEVVEVLGLGIEGEERHAEPVGKARLGAATLRHAAFSEELDHLLSQAPAVPLQIFSLVELILQGHHPEQVCREHPYVLPPKLDAAAVLKYSQALLHPAP
mmetsp:Transcript_713/g.1712  ORF Transcript_713/g.1712 Transcript_713/m.1712 type:complete len:306 (-) Transcript_713:752-1669(-)